MSTGVYPDVDCSLKYDAGIGMIEYCWLCAGKLLLSNKPLSPVSLLVDLILMSVCICCTLCVYNGMYELNVSSRMSTPFLNRQWKVAKKNQRLYFCGLAV